MLYQPEAHVPLVESRWDPARALGAVREIVEDTEAAFEGGWPNHPRDEEGERRLRTVFLGAAGVVQALDQLRRRGLVELRHDYIPFLERAYEPDFPELEPDHERSLWMGETGIRLVLQRLTPSGENADRLAELVAANARDERRELMWGSPGTMLAARTMHDLTGEARWLELWRESAAWLRSQWDPETSLWTQHLYGRVDRHLGPAHGLAGCVLALLPEADDELHRRAADCIRRHAVEEDGMANWPPTSSVGLMSRRGQVRVQWCHGAPGIVASLGSVAPTDDEHERLLLAGGELTWRVGPLAKGANLCHGTAGNGYAFLALFERTGDELWLDRARAFAMHAAAQVSSERAEHGRGRYTLWTGDPGTALYLADCVRGSGGLPLP